jgi:predicted acetyltransferase
MNVDTVIIRPMIPDELEAVAHVRAIGFGISEEKALNAFKNDPRYDASHTLVADDGGQIIGSATVFPAKMWLSGVPMSIGAATAITVLPEFRGSGIAAKMTRFVILRSFEEGHALSVLFPFSHQYYSKFGYRTISDLHVYRIQRDNLDVSAEEAAKVRPFNPTDLRMMRVMYKGQLTWHNGWFTRSDEWWDKLVQSWPKLMVFDNDGMIEGYYAYDIKINDSNERVLHLKEFFAPEGPTYRALIASLAAQDEAEIIQYLAPADTLLRYSLRQPTAHRAQNHEWIFKDLCYVTPGPMGRIINLPKALTSRFYTRGLSGERILQVTDPLIPANETPLVFRLVDGRAETRPAEAGKPQIETDIATLSQVLCGYMKAIEAYRLGLLKASEETCTWLDKIIVDTPLYIQPGDWF